MRNCAIIHPLHLELETTLAKRWIENKFAQELEQSKYHQAREIERLRAEINSMLSGALKMQEKEFETLPEAWFKLDEAYGRVSDLAAPVQLYPDLDRMTPDQLEEFLDSSNLLETQKQDVRQSNEKAKAYKEEIFWHRLRAVKQACRDLHNYANRYGIFFPPELKDLFTKVSEELWSAVSYKEVGQEAKDYKMQNEAWDKIKTNIDPLYKSIESNIHARLRSHSRGQ